jgi:hypothetical protein
MNDSQVLKQLAETDAHAPDTEMSNLAWSRETARFEIERRMGMDPQESTNKQGHPVSTVQPEPTDGSHVATRPPQTNRRQPWLIAAGAFAVTLLVVAGVALLNSTDQPFDAESSLAVADDYFAEFNAGEREAVMALFTPDATFTVGFIGDPAEPSLRSIWEERLEWNTAQGTIMTTHDCVVIDEAPGAVTISCDYGTHDAAAQAVDAVAVPTTTTMKVMPDGISEFDELYGGPDFTYVGDRFLAWMTKNNPADALAAAGFGNWSSLDEAGEHGGIRAQYADEWAAELQAAGCTFNQLAEC